MVKEKQDNFDYSEIIEESNFLLGDIEERIKLCLKDTYKKKQDGMPPHLKEHWDAEALGYKTSLECIKRTREKFNIYLDAPCVVCQKKEEVDSGMCEDCLKEAINHLKLNSENSIPPNPKGIGYP